MAEARVTLNTSGFEDGARKVSTVASAIVADIGRISTAAAAAQASLSNIGGTTAGLTSQTQATTALTTAVNSLSTSANSMSTTMQKATAAMRRTTGATRQASAGASALRRDVERLSGSLAVLAAGPLSGFGSRVIALSSAFEVASRSAISFGPLMAGFAAVTAAAIPVVFALNKEVLEFEQSIANLSALTGFTPDTGLDDLRQSAIELGSATTLSARQVAEGFTIIGSLRPELLKSGEALEEVTKQAITLAEASGITLPDAAKSLTGILNQFQVPSSAAADVVNVLAAAAQAGAATIPTLTEALKKAGPVAAAFGLSVQKTAATLEILAETGLTAEETGTQLRNIFFTLQAGGATADTFTQSLEALAAEQLSGTEIADKFGVRQASLVISLLQNVHRIDEFTEAITGTTKATEQAAARTDTTEAAIQRLGSAWERLKISVAESDGEVRAFIDTLSTLVNFVATQFEGPGDPIARAEEIARERARLAVDTAARRAKASDRNEFSGTNVGILIDEARVRFNERLNSGLSVTEALLGRQIGDLNKIGELEQQISNVRDLRERKLKELEESGGPGTISRLLNAIGFDSDLENLDQLLAKLQFELELRRELQRIQEVENPADVAAGRATGDGLNRPLTFQEALFQGEASRAQQVFKLPEALVDLEREAQEAADALKALEEGGPTELRRVEAYQKAQAVVRGLTQTERDNAIGFLKLGEIGTGALSERIAAQLESLELSKQQVKALQDLLQRQEDIETNTQKFITATQQENDAIRAQIAAQSLSEEARRAANIELEFSAELLRLEARDIDVTSEAVLREARARVELKESLREETAARKVREAEARKDARDIERIFDQTKNRISQSLSEAFVASFDFAREEAFDFSEFLISLMRDTAEEIARQLIFQPIVDVGVDALRGSGGVGSLLSGGAGGFAEFFQNFGEPTPGDADFVGPVAESGLSSAAGGVAGLGGSLAGGAALGLAGFGVSSAISGNLGTNFQGGLAAGSLASLPILAFGNPLLGAATALFTAGLFATIDALKDRLGKVSVAITTAERGVAAPQLTTNPSSFLNDVFRRIDKGRLTESEAALFVTEQLQKSGVNPDVTVSVEDLRRAREGVFFDPIESFSPFGSVQVSSLKIPQSTVAKTTNTGVIRFDPNEQIDLDTPLLKQRGSDFLEAVRRTTEQIGAFQSTVVSFLTLAQTDVVGDALRDLEVGFKVRSVQGKNFQRLIKEQARTVLEALEIEPDRILGQGKKFRDDEKQAFEDALRANQTYAQSLRELAGEIVPSTEQAFIRLGEVFRSAIQAADLLGKSAEEAFNAQLQGQQNIVGTFADTIAQGILGFTDPFSAALFDQQQGNEQRLADAAAVAARFGDEVAQPLFDSINLLNGLEIGQLIDQRNAPLRDLEENLTIGSAGGLTVIERLANARTAQEEALAGGDPAEIAAITATVVELSRAANASGAAFQEDRLRALEIAEQFQLNPEDFGGLTPSDLDEFLGEKSIMILALRAIESAVKGEQSKTKILSGIDEEVAP